MKSLQQFLNRREYGGESLDSFLRKDIRMQFESSTVPTAEARLLLQYLPSQALPRLWQDLRQKTVLQDNWLAIFEACYGSTTQALFDKLRETTEQGTHFYSAANLQKLLCRNECGVEELAQALTWMPECVFSQSILDQMAASQVAMEAALLLEALYWCTDEGDVEPKLPMDHDRIIQSVLPLRDFMDSIDKSSPDPIHVDLLVNILFSLTCNLVTTFDHKPVLMAIYQCLSQVSHTLLCDKVEAALNQRAAVNIFMGRQLSLNIRAEVANWHDPSIPNTGSSQSLGIAPCWPSFANTSMGDYMPAIQRTRL